MTEPNVAGARKKRKVFRWTPDLVKELLDNLAAYKASMEFKKIAISNGDKNAQYEEQLAESSSPRHMRMIWIYLASVAC